jgi:hypothetical protein
MGGVSSLPMKKGFKGLRVQGFEGTRTLEPYLGGIYV